MSFIPNFIVGTTVKNTDVVNEFKCGNMGGMRRSNSTNTLVIISDYTKGLYEDKWFGEILHYTGMGKNGDQDLNFMQNRTLAESARNGVDVHLFEVIKAGQYIYKGSVELCDKPYQESQKGEDGLLRKVWIFPLRLKSGEVPLEYEVFEAYEETKRRRARRLSLVQVKQRARENESTKVGVRSVKVASYIRDPYVSEYAKRIANGICQLCGQLAPFADENNKPYLETHHIVWLSEGGPDTIDNTVAICPNCHRQMHVLNQQRDKELLQQKARGYGDSPND